MPAKIRLARHGRKSRPYYYIVVADSRAPRDGKFIERIGSYNPVTNPATIDLDFDRALSWIQKGAQPTDTARSILKAHGVMLKHHLIKGISKGAITEDQVEEKFQAWMQEKESQNESVIKKLDEEKRADKKSRLAAESKVREAMAAELAKKNADLAAEDEVEVVEEVVEEAPVVVEAPAKEEAPVKVEEPKAEVAPAKEDAPAAKVEEPKAETPKEPAGEEKKEEK